MSLLALLLLLALKVLLLDTARDTKYLSVNRDGWIIGLLTVLAQPGTSFP